MNVKSICNFIIIVCIFFAAAVSINSAFLNSIALYVAIPLAFLLCFIRSKKLCPNRYEAILITLYIWDLISVSWAQYLLNASIELHKILGAFLVTYIMSVSCQDKRIWKYMYISFLVLYIGAWYYAHNNSLVNIEITNNLERLGDDKLNANTMAYYTFFSTIAIYLLASMMQKDIWKKICNLGFLAMIPLSFFVALVTASRQVLIMQIPLIVLLIFERYLRETTRQTKVIFIIMIIILAVVLFPVTLDIYNNSFLAYRSHTDVQEDVRWTILKDAFQVGFANFLLGVGAGNYIKYSLTHHFSHCSYAELFANNGIVGLFLYCYLLSYFIKMQWKRFKLTKDRHFIIFLIFGFAYVFDQFFYVFYTDLWLMSFFILVATHSDAYYIQLMKQQKINSRFVYERNMV